MNPLRGRFHRDSSAVRTSRREGRLAGSARTAGLLLALAIPTAAHAQPDSVRVSVTVEGLDGDLQTNVEAVVRLIVREGDRLAPGRARALFRRAPDEIRLALEPFGRYQPTIDAEIADQGEDWTASFRVDPGPATIVTRLDFALTGAGAADSGFVMLADSFPIAEGDTLSHADYEVQKAAFQRYATNKGYFDAAFDTAQILVDRSANTAEVLFRFDTGSRYTFGPITVEQDVLLPQYVDGYVTAAPGEPFDADLLRASQVALTTGPWFGRADIEVKPGEAVDNVVPVNFLLTPSPPQRYEAALGYGTDTGARVTLGAKFRRINRHAHNAEAELRVSQIEKSAAGRYNIPRAFPATGVFSAFGSFGDVSPSWSSSLVGTVGLSYSNTIGPVRQTLSLAWEGSWYEVADQNDNASLFVPQVQWSWVQANDRLVATHGHRLNLTVNGSFPPSSATFLSTDLEGKIIRSPFSRSRVMARAEVGYILVDDIRDLPPTRRFVSGGDQTVRGFGFESIGPTDGEDRLIGGRALLLGSLETDFEVIPKWRIAAFGDAGNAMADFSSTDFEYSVGVGIRWASPLGLIRFDGAFPLSDVGRTFRLHFTIGPDL